jgi:hypothetical protein
MIMRPDVDPSPSIEILKTFDPKKPFHINFGIGWDIRPQLSKPPTTAVTRPTTQRGPAASTHA